MDIRYYPLGLLRVSPPLDHLLVKLLIAQDFLVAPPFVHLSAVARPAIIGLEFLLAGPEVQQHLVFDKLLTFYANGM